MEIFLLVSVCLFLLLGLVGCVVPFIPGPLVSYIAVLLLIPSRFALSTKANILLGIGCLVVIVFDFIVPAVGAKKFNCSRWGVTGALIGSIAGLFFGIPGLLTFPFIGAFLGEMISGKKFLPSIKGGTGAFLGFLSGVLIKFVYSSICLVWCAYVIIKIMF
jgi:uncharacterized protein YqgC (DUF456 family)